MEMSMEHFFIVIPKCLKCNGTGVLKRRRSWCEDCKGTGFNYDHDSIEIDEGQLLELLEFRSISNQGTKWLSFVDWSQLVTISQRQNTA
jgi:DnaJ-class molecular chaperone